MSERQTIKNWQDSDKKVRGPNIPDDWRRYILAQAISESHKPRMLLADEILKQMQETRDRLDKLPERESIAKLISRARTHERPFDKSWSIGASLKYGLPPEASRELFYMWRVSLALERPITIRQARWIVYLRDISLEHLPQSTYPLKVRRSLWLISQSWLYSIRERVSEIMGEEDFDTTALDAASFMPNWEYNTALKLGKASEVMFPQEQLTKLEQYGVTLTGPPRHGFSVEQAVWHNVRTEPPSNMEVVDIGLGEEPLPEEDDLVAAYWLTHLSKGPLWNNLPPRPEVRRFYEEQRRLRESGHFVPDSGGFPDDSMYSRQLAIRHKLLDWVKAHHSMSIRDYYSLGKTPHRSLVLSPKLLTAVGYEVSPEDHKLYAKLHENELKQEHLGWDALPADVQQRFIHDEQTDNDLTVLEDADNKSRIEQEQLEQELLELVQHQDGVPIGKSREEHKTFWRSIRDKWIKKYPEYAKNKLWYPQGEDFEREYERIIKERNLHNKSSDSTKGGTK